MPAFIIFFFICIAFGVFFSIQEKKNNDLLIESAKRYGYFGFTKDISFNDTFHIDVSRKIFATKRNDDYMIIPFSALKEVSHQIIYDYKTESNASFSQGLADGVVSGITGVGIIREIREEQVEYIKDLILKLNFNHNGRYFVEEVSVTGDRASSVSSILNFLSAILENNKVHASKEPAPQPNVQQSTIVKSNPPTAPINQTISASPTSTIKKPMTVDKTTWGSRIDEALKKPNEEKVADLLTIGEEGSCRAYNLLGLHYSNLNDFQNALQYYQFAYSLNPNDGNVLNNLGFLYSKENFSGFNLKQALVYFRKANIGTAYHNMGGIYDGTVGGKKDSRFINYDLAIYYYEKALSIGYDNDVTLNNLGRLYGDKKGKHILAATYCFLSGQKGNSTGKNNFNSYKENIPESQKQIWFSNITMLSSYKEIEDMILRVSNALSIPPELPQSKTQKLEDIPDVTTNENYHLDLLKKNIKELFSSSPYANDEIVFNIRNELAILKPSNKICITKEIESKTRYYIVDAFDTCSYRKSNGNLFMTFKYNGDLPNDATHRMFPGREIKVLTATQEESESVFSHIQAYLSINKINHF